MNRMRLAVSLSLALGACGSEAAATAPAPAPAPPPVAAAAPTPTAAPTPSTAAAPTAPTAAPTLEELIRTVPPVVPQPAAQTAGTVTLTPTLCTLDGPPIIGDDDFRSIGAIAWSTDGALYLLDNDARLRRYTPQTGAACALTMDATLGDAGRLDLGSGLGRAPESVVADAHGHVFVASAQGGTTRITGTHVDYHCDTRGDLSVSPSGEEGFALFGTGPVRHVRFTDEGCTVEDWTADELFGRVDSISFLDAQHVLVGGQAGDVRSPHQARVYAPTGRASGAAFGDTSDSTLPPDHFCYVHEAHECGDHTCVVDGNCRSIRIFDDAHIVGAVDMMHLAGLHYPWFPSMTEVRDGTAYVTAVQQRGEHYPRPDVYDGFVLRLTGF